MEALAVHPTGEQPAVEPADDTPVVAETFAGRVHLEWELAAPVTMMGQLAFFIEYLTQGGLFDGWAAGCPLLLTSPNAPTNRDVLGTVLVSVLAGHWRYAHITALRADAVNATLPGMNKVVSEDAVRRALGKIDEVAGIAWLREQLEYCVQPLLSEPWILDVDTTVKPLYGHQQAGEVSYNPSKRGRPSQVSHSYLMAELRLVLEVEVAGGKAHTAKHAAPGLWALLDRHRDDCLLDFRGGAVLQHRLAAADLLQRQLAAFVVELLEAVEAVAAVAHHLAGLADPRFREGRLLPSCLASSSSPSLARMIFWS
jgi:hypothetical protein